MDISPATPLGELLAEARRIRDRWHGTRVTFSPKVFIPLTMLCRDHCGYCTFAKPPARLGTSAYLAPEQVLEIARAGAAAGCSEALFTLGERPEERYTLAGQALADLGHDSTVGYLAESCRLVLTETGLLPHANAGALRPDELAALRPVAASQGMMLESLSERLHQPGGPHARCQTKLPDRRLATLEAAGELAIPFTTGILVGIGETRAERLEALAAIGAAHRRHGHVQEVIVQNFRPKPGTAMAAVAPPSQEDYLWTIAAARVLLDPGIHLQAPPNLTEDFGALLEAGIDDWGAGRGGGRAAARHRRAGGAVRGQGPGGPGGGRGRRRPAPPGCRGRGHLCPQPQHQLHQRLHLPLPLLRLLQGAGQPQPAGRALPARP
jgi:FO synthase